MGILSNNVDYFGIDVGYTGIRLVQLKKGGNHPSLVTYGHVAVETGLTTSDSPADITKVASIIKQLVKDARVTTKRVVAGLPSSKVYASVITTPVLSHQDLGKAINLQADQYIPMSIKEVKLDWLVLGPGKTPNEQEVLVVAAPNAATQKFVSIFEQAGLELLALEPNAVALARAVVQRNGVAVLVLDVGGFYSDITIVHNNVPKLLRSVNVGGSVFIKAVAQNLGLDMAQAQQFTYKFGLTKTKLEGQVLKAIEPSVKQLVDEIDRSTKFFATQNPDVKLEKIVLTGGTMALPELPAYLSTVTGLPVEIANAWVNVGYPAGMQDTLMQLSSHYGVAVGLAERDLLQ